MFTQNDTLISINYFSLIADCHLIQHLIRELLKAGKWMRRYSKRFRWHFIKIRGSDNCWVSWKYRVKNLLFWSSGVNSKVIKQVWKIISNKTWPYKVHKTNLRSNERKHLPLLLKTYWRRNNFLNAVGRLLS